MPPWVSGAGPEAPRSITSLRRDQVHIRRLLPAVVAAGIALGVAACGSDSGSSNNSSTTSKSAGTPFSGAAPGEGKKGGHLTALAAGDVDYVDPGQTYYSFGYMIHYAVNRTLYSYGPGDIEKPRPDIAEGPPEVSADQKTVTVKLRKGIKFSPPVNREITSKDIKYAFERAFSTHVPSPYATVYFTDIVGAPSKPTNDIPDISGIETPDDSTIVFKLKSPSAALISQALAMPISTPVPEEYAKKFDAKSPSTYDNYVAFTGPYMYKNDSSGKLVGRQPGKSIQLVRNPNWDPKTDYRPAYLDSITIEEGNDDSVSSARRILKGQSLVQGDGTTPAPVIKQAVSQNKDQIAFIPGGGYRFISMNSTIKPFDNLNVRKAVVAASDRKALQLTRGGDSAGELATHYLPFDFPGFEEAGGAKGPSLDFMANPSGDMALAKKYMLAAKKEDASLPIDANGMWTDSTPLLMVASNADPGKKTGEVAQAQFEKLGFKIKFRTVPQDTLYTKFCNVPAQKIAICPNVGWFKDFNDPQAVLDAVFNGKNIIPQNNSNWTQLNVPAINDAMAKAAALPAGDERIKAWAKIDDMVTAQAPGIVYLWDKIPTVEASNVRGVVNQYSTSWDLDFTSLK
jgi:peptide/nickel transport system substrate-binding protein